MIRKILLLLLFSTRLFAVEPFLVEDMRITGADRISQGTIFSYLPIERGDTVDLNAIKAAIKSLFDTGYFSDIKLFREDNVLIVNVSERPAIAAIDIDGNKSIKTEELMSGLSGLGMAEGEVYDKLQLDRVQNELVRQFYSRGNYNVKVDTNVRELDRNRVRININIDEGKAAKIKHIKVVGNTIFSDEELIEAFESGTTNWLSMFSKNDQYSKEKLNGDLEILKSYYLNRGYVDADIESVQVTISDDKKDVYITANVQEGEQYSFGDIEMTGELIFEKDTLEKFLVSQSGETFSQQLNEYNVERIKALLSNRGYAFAEVQPMATINAEDKTVDVTYYVNPGKRVYVRRINFSGNVKTKDEVLRREMRQFEGAWFSQALVDRSKLRLQQKPYFEQVEIETPRVPGSDDQVDVNVTVKEKNSGQFTFGFGYSQLAGFTISTSVSLQNLLGTGNTLSLAVNQSDFYKRLNFFYQNPYFSDEGVAVGYSMNFTTIDQGDANRARYNSSNGSLGMQVSFPITEYDRIFTSFAYERIGLRAFETQTADAIIDDLIDLGGYAYTCFLIDRPDDPSTLPPLTEQCNDDPSIDPTTVKIPSEYRRSFTFYKAEARWSRDSRNRFFNPTRGNFHSIGVEFALPNSTAEFYKINLKENVVFPLTKQLVLSLSGEIGYGDGYGDTSTLPFFEHFITGGVNSIRGYEDNTLGPKSSINDNNLTESELSEPLTSRPGDPIGGSFKVLASAELVFPTPFAKAGNAARLAWFFDVGNVFDGIDAFEARELRMSSGIALKWQAPVGPIVLSYAFPFNSDDDDRIEQLQFSFQNSF